MLSLDSSDFTHPSHMVLLAARSLLTRCAITNFSSSFHTLLCCQSSMPLLSQLACSVLAVMDVCVLLVRLASQQICGLAFTEPGNKPFPAAHQDHRYGASHHEP